MADPQPLAELVADGVAGDVTPTQRWESLWYAIDASERPEAWIERTPLEPLMQRARALEALDEGERRSLPLYGLAFAVKDNIDVAGLPTTAGCPAYAYRPDRSAHVVERLERAGAVVLGKTHLDQFATGLVGTRSPHGPCRNAYRGDVISGGSSSGSAVAVAQNLADFSLGTDTAGSGRVPAALAGIVGLKPTRGLLSGRGVVPACRSLDCVSLFARTVADAAAVLTEAADFDPADPFARHAPVSPASGVPRLRFATPVGADLEGVEAGIRAHFDAVVAALTAAGGERREIDYTAFREAGRLLYAGPYVAERHAAVGAFIAEHPNDVDPVVGAIIRDAARHSASDLFASLHRLRALQARSERVFEEIDLLVVPTIPRIFRIEEVQRRPVETNAELGRFNDFVNLLDLCACVVPVGMLEAGVPCGVTLIAPAFAESFLLRVASELAKRLAPVPAPPTRDARIELAVVGAHLRGMPLHRELLAHGAVFERALRTKPHYRLFALADTTPAKPGLTRVSVGGASIEVEVYSLPATGFARFVASVPAPLCIGRIQLADGTTPSGFLCEPIGLAGARDITASGGWRTWCDAR